MSKQIYPRDWHENAIELAKEGISWRSISKELGIARTTVSDYLRKVFSNNKPNQESITTVRKKDSDKEYDNSRILLISDLHCPFHHPDALSFLSYLKDKYNPTRIINGGDECFPGDVEILTDIGWQRIDDYAENWNNGIVNKVLQVNDDLIGEMVIPERIVFKESVPEILQYKTKSLVSRTTPKHNVVIQNPRTKKLHRREAWDFAGTTNWYIPRRLKGLIADKRISLTDDEIRLMVAFQADGTFTKGAARFAFTKKRKVERLHNLLTECNVQYHMHEIERGDVQFYINKVDVPEYFTKIFSERFKLTDFSFEQAKVFCDELVHWDGTPIAGGIRYSSYVKENLSFVSSLAVLGGYLSSQEKDKYIDIRNKTENSSLKSAKPEIIEHNAPVYCVTVPSGMIMTRQSGTVSISGNCDSHALSYHEHDPDGYSAGHELIEAKRAIKELHDMFPEMTLLESNHGSLVYRKAKTHGIPKHYIKSYNDVLEVGSGWKWVYDLTITLPNGEKCYLHHGKNNNGLRFAQTMGMNVAQFHYHNTFRIEYFGNPNGLYWSIQNGCLIHDDSYAFAYNNVNMLRPVIGTGVIIDSQPILEPMILDKTGRWIKR